MLYILSSYAVLWILFCLEHFFETYTGTVCPFYAYLFHYSRESCKDTDFPSSLLTNEYDLDRLSNIVWILCISFSRMAV